MDKSSLLLELPDDLYQRLLRLANLTGRPVTGLLIELLRRMVPPLPSSDELHHLYTRDTDKRVLDTADIDLPSAQADQLVALLQQEGAGELDPSNRKELDELMQYYRDVMLRRAEARAEAVRRGLRDEIK